ncbi:hypothetical protein F4811DRAFT_565872 [Daldinia bambusicola]|nr:hypothetical protein F4811DRAFT_565872 [Daldinia bambusicola]
MYATLYGDFNLGSLEVGETGGTKYTIQGFAASQLVRRTFASIRILEVRKQRLPEISEPHPFPTFNAGSLGSQPDLAGLRSSRDAAETQQRRAWVQTQTNKNNHHLTCVGIASPETCQVTPLSSLRNKVAPLFGNPRLLDGEGYKAPLGGDGTASTSIS